jgi:GTPase SAR1 family protein
MSSSTETQGALPVVSLQSKDHEELLNIIDNLRSQGISRYIDIAQIIVCGDQSSGKSSVLEAVSGLRFPSKDNLCTRFATELVLRRLAVNSSTVTIVPDAARTEEDKKVLQAFKPTSTFQEDFGGIIESAGTAMGLGHGGKVFSTDILRVEITGPALPHLTLVDLPGLFQAGSKAQSDADVESVKSLVTSYMKKSRSIILAVVSAKSDFNLQIV